VAVTAAIATEGLTMDWQTQQHLEQLRARAEPEVRTFVEWAGGELADKLTKDFLSFGLPPMQARKEAQAAVTLLCKRVLGVARTWHRFHR
jgi:hypothetical protein